MADKFIFEYDAVTGVYMAAALREKAQAERAEALRIRSAMTLNSSPLDLTLIEQAVNRAKLLEDAADKIHAPVRAALMDDFDEALKRQGL